MKVNMDKYIYIFSCYLHIYIFIYIYIYISTNSHSLTLSVCLSLTLSVSISKYIYIIYISSTYSQIVQDSLHTNPHPLYHAFILYFNILADNHTKFLKIDITCYKMSHIYWKLILYWILASLYFRWLICMENIWNLSTTSRRVTFVSLFPNKKTSLCYDYYRLYVEKSIWYNKEGLSFILEHAVPDYSLRRSS